AAGWPAPPPPRGGAFCVAPPGGPGRGRPPPPLSRLPYGPRQVLQFVGRYYEPLRGQRLHELHLMVIDVLSESPPSRHHDRDLTQSDRGQLRGAAVTDDQTGRGEMSLQLLRRQQR